MLLSCRFKELSLLGTLSLVEVAIITSVIIKLSIYSINEPMPIIVVVVVVTEDGAILFPMH